MNAPTVQCTFLDWDSDFFGVPIGRARVKRLTRRELDEIDRWAFAQGLRCAYVMCDEADEEIAGSAEFVLADARVTYLSQGQGWMGSPQVRLARPEDGESLEEIARTSHRNTRFYRDGHFPPERCDELYVQWIRASLAGERARAVFVADEGKGAIGYVTCETHAGSPAAHIGLIAVAPELRGRGHGKNLLAAVNDYVKNLDKWQVRAVTQQENTPAMRMYESAGFAPLFTQLCFHKWYEQGSVPHA
jgi:dTDP-4-amino-4,6-dideoxy-D-galactose acyltransferase